MEKSLQSTFSEKLIDSATGSQSRNTSIVIQSSNYNILFSSPSTTFHGISPDPLYKFPILLIQKPSRVILNLSSFTSADSIDIKQTFSNFHKTSPFQRTVRSNLPSNESSYVSSYKNTLELSGSYLKSSRFCDSFKRSSILSSESPVRSYLANLNVDTGLSFSSAGSEILSNQNIGEISQIDWEEKTVLSSDEAVVTEEKNSEIIVQLLAEEETDNSDLLYNSIDALRKADLLLDEDYDSVIDEGSTRVSTANRVFLRGHTASKDKLTHTDHTSSSKITYPDLSSPLIRKISIFEEPEDFHLVESRDSKYLVKSLHLIFSIAAVGCSSAPSIEYSNTESNSKALISKNLTAPLYSLFSKKILKQLKNLNVKLVSCGHEHAAVLTVDGKVLTWGYGASGCLGHENKKSYSHPTAINSIFNKNIVYLECGAYHTAAVSANGGLWTWGRGDVGQLGLAEEKMSKDENGLLCLRPARVKWLENVRSVSCGEAHTLVLNAFGQVFAFGWNEDGQVGDCKSVNLGKKAVKVSAGALFSVVLTDDGEIWVWGNGETGQLGLGNLRTSVKIPSKIQLDAVFDFVCGENSVIAFGKNGKIWAWGKGIVSSFADAKMFPPGSDVVSFLPHEISEVDIVQKVLIKKRRFM